MDAALVLTLGLVGHGSIRSDWRGTGVNYESLTYRSEYACYPDNEESAAYETGESDAPLSRLN